MPAQDVPTPARWRQGSRATAAALLSLPLVAVAQLPGLVEPAADHGLVVSPAWKRLGLPEQKPPLTLYTAERVDGRAALRIDAQGSYGNLVHEVLGGPPLRTLQWRWRMARPNDRADLRSKAGDDVAARVCLSFDLPLERVPFVERQLLRLARARSGQELPAATLCWVWDRALPVGTVVENVYSRRVRMIVARNATHPGETWLDEAHDVAAGWRAAFGDEAATPPPVRAVIVAGDSDNTGERTLAHVADLRAGP